MNSCSLNLNISKPIENTQLSGGISSANIPAQATSKTGLIRKNTLYDLNSNVRSQIFSFLDPQSKKNFSETSSALRITANENYNAFRLAVNLASHETRFNLSQILEGV